MSEVKKVLFVATVDSHIIHFHLPYLKLFKERGYEVHVATNGDGTIPYCDVKHQIPLERSPIRIANLKAIGKLKKIIDSEKFQTIHCHTPMGGAITRIASIASRRKNKTKVIYTAHGFHFYKGSPMLNWLVFYPVEKYLARFTDILITINEEDYMIAKDKFKSSSIYLIKGVGIDVQKFEVEVSEEEINTLREKIDVDQDDFCIIYIAELTKRKNQLMTLKVLKELIKFNKSIKLLLVGQDSRHGYYQKKANELGVNDNVKFLGYRKDITNLIKSSNLAISTSLQEGLPVNILENMISGIPLVVTNCRGNRDLVKNGINGYVTEINNDEDMANKILKLKNDKELCHQFSLENRKIAKQYDLELIMEKMKEIYKIE